MYPRLTPGYLLKKAGHGKKLETLQPFHAVGELKKELKKGKLYIIPRRAISFSDNSVSYIHCSLTKMLRDIPENTQLVS